MTRAKLSPLHQLQEALWGWHDMRARSKPKFSSGGWPEYSQTEIAALVCEITGAAEAEGETMAIGKRKSSSAAFDNVLKIDGRTGAITRGVREQGSDGQWVTTHVTIPLDAFEATLDVAAMKVGWLCFNPPDFRLVPIGSDYGASPSDGHKEGIQARLVLRNGAGTGVHELSSTSVLMWTSLDELHDEYTAARGKHKGKVPVIRIAEMIRVTGRNGTNYRPSFAIVGWVAPPAELATAPQARAPRKAAAVDLDTPVSM